jgi:hypothetical protein
LENCPCCDTLNPSADHLIIHSSNLCQKEPLEKRTYSRADGLIQHMRQYHFKEYVDTPKRRRRLREEWRIESEEIPQDSPVLLCGFCGDRSKCWKDRIEHVGRHFQMGADMTHWWIKRADMCCITNTFASEINNHNPASDLSSTVPDNNPRSDNLFDHLPFREKENHSQSLCLVCNSSVMDAVWHD